VLKDDTPTTNALEGDDLTLEHYEDGNPKLPAFLDRRKKRMAEAA
jgi:hypothetical protein